MSEPIPRRAKGERIPLAIDVAFSFLTADERLARQLAELIQDQAAPFVFSEQQKQLAGTNGAATLTRLYEEAATLAVVLYRTGYGSTNWTRLEESAITSRGLKQGWDTVFLISLDGTKPNWLPTARLWFGIEQFGVKVGADAILARFAELRESGRPESHLQRAARVAQRLVSGEEASRWRQTVDAVQAVQTELKWMREYLSAEVDGLNEVAHMLHARYVTPDHWVFGVDAQGAAVTLGWSFQYSNTLSGSALVVRERAAPDIRDKPIRLRYARGLETVREVEYEAVLGDKRTVLWQSNEKGEPCFTSRQVADRHLRHLVDLSGQVLGRAHERLNQ